MHLSLREIAQCVDAPEEFSMMRDFFGFSTGDPINVGTISVREQIEAVRGKHIHLDFILVAPSDISHTDRRWLDHGINGTRVILKAVGIGIGRIRYYAIPKENADGYDVITSKWEAKELTRRYRGPNDDAMDIFIVPQYNVITRRGKVKTGICNIMGCEKDLYAFNGCVIGMRNLSGTITHPVLQTATTLFYAITLLLAHELGHGLNLIHRDIDGNLMQTGKGKGVDLTSQQGRRMRRDCFVHDGCSG
jgi:hypothetical protein